MTWPWLTAHAYDRRVAEPIVLIYVFMYEFAEEYVILYASLLQPYESYSVLSPLACHPPFFYVLFLVGQLENTDGVCYSTAPPVQYGGGHSINTISLSLSLSLARFRARSLSLHSTFSPICMLTIVCCVDGPTNYPPRCLRYHIPYQPWCAVTLFWVALGCMLLASVNTCKFIHSFTRFSGELFGFLIAILFLQQGIKGLTEE